MTSTQKTVSEVIRVNKCFSIHAFQLWEEKVGIIIGDIDFGLISHLSLARHMKSKGAVVQTVLVPSHAHSAGIKPGDVFCEMLSSISCASLRERIEQNGDVNFPSQKEVVEQIRQTERPLNIYLIRKHGGSFLSSLSTRRISITKGVGIKETKESYILLLRL